MAKVECFTTSHKYMNCKMTLTPSSSRKTIDEADTNIAIHIEVSYDKLGCDGGKYEWK